MFYRKRWSQSLKERPIRLRSQRGRSSTLEIFLKVYSTKPVVGISVVEWSYLLRHQEAADTEGFSWIICLSSTQTPLQTSRWSPPENNKTIKQRNYELTWGRRSNKSKTARQVIFVKFHCRNESDSCACFSAFLSRRFLTKLPEKEVISLCFVIKRRPTKSSPLVSLALLQSNIQYCYPHF